MSNPNPGYQVTLYGIEALQARTKGQGIKIAILDTGVDLAHPDLQGVNWGAKKNLMTGATTDDAVLDSVGHGTHCAGIIAAQGIGVTGIAPEATLLIGKINENDYGLQEAPLLAGIKWAYAEGADVISISQTITLVSDNFETEVQALAAANPNVFIAAAMGNTGNLGFPSANYPASLASVIGVGAVMKTFAMDPITSYSDSLAILGPGNQIYSTWVAGGYQYQTGTSMATPMVASVAALMFSLANQNGLSLTAARMGSEMAASAQRTATFSGISTQYPIIDPTNLATVLFPVA